MFYWPWMTLLKLTQVGQDIPWLHSLSISSLSRLPRWWPTTQPLIRSSLLCPGSATHTAFQPTPPCSQTCQIKHLDADLVSPGAKSQLLSELCVYTVVLAAPLIIEIFGNKPVKLQSPALNLLSIFAKKLGTSGESSQFIGLISWLYFVQILKTLT